jgi:hypothetical protein
MAEQASTECRFLRSSNLATQEATKEAAKKSRKRNKA